jgi:hypothetical protein
MSPSCDFDSVVWASVVLGLDTDMAARVVAGV